MPEDVHTFLEFIQEGGSWLLVLVSIATFFATLFFITDERYSEKSFLSHYISGSVLLFVAIMTLVGAIMFGEVYPGYNWNTLILWGGFVAGYVTVGIALGLIISARTKTRRSRHHQ